MPQAIRTDESCKEQPHSLPLKDVIIQVGGVVVLPGQWLGGRVGSDRA